MSLTPKRVMRLMQSLNSTAVKVYAAVPIAEAWELKDIQGELARTGKNLHVKGVHGSLRHMVEIGLIREVRPNTYQQVPIIRTIPQEQEQETMVTPVTTARPKVDMTKPQSPFERIEGKLNNVIEVANTLQHMIKGISDELLELQIAQEEEAKKYAKIAELLDAIGSLKK